AARRRLADLFQAASLDAFGTFNDAEAVAAMLAVDYVRSTQAGALPRLARPAPMGEAGGMAMTAAARATSRRCATRGPRRMRRRWLWTARCLKSWRPRARRWPRHCRSRPL